MLLGVLVEAVKTVTLIERENLDAEVARKAPLSHCWFRVSGLGFRV